MPEGAIESISEAAVLLLVALVGSEVLSGILLCAALAARC
jgi:hypothetical protein